MNDVSQGARLSALYAQMQQSDEATAPRNRKQIVNAKHYALQYSVDWSAYTSTFSDDVLAVMNMIHSNNLFS